MEVRDRQHRRVLILVGMIILMAAVSLWRELVFAGIGGTQVTSLSGAAIQFGLMATIMLVLIGMVPVVLLQSSKDTKQIGDLAFVDELTGLPNRRQFDIRLQQELDRCRRHGGMLAAVYFDLDGFKAVNDCYGHAAGDVAIRTFGKRIRTMLRGQDMLARLSGDEFACIMTELTDPKHVATMADRVIAAMREPIIIDSKSVYVGVSMGASIVQDGSLDAASVLQQADFALFRAKNGGRNQLKVFDPVMAQHVQARKRLEVDLRNAVESGGLFLEYQPQFARDGRTLKGVEALARWTHSELGPISPSAFIPLVEELGLIDRFGEAVFRRACHDIAPLPGLKLAVNVSAVQFRQKRFVEIVESALLESGLHPSRLELDVSEQTFADDPELAVQTFGRLRQHGITVALGDFGMGRASLNKIRDLPLDRIKIDRSFVRGMDTSQEALKVVSTMIDLGAELGLAVTVEGIETERQLKLLARTRCDEMQGFFFCRPASIEQVKMRVAISSAPPASQQSAAVQAEPQPVLKLAG